MKQIILCDRSKQLSKEIALLCKTQSVSLAKLILNFTNENSDECHISLQSSSALILFSLTISLQTNLTRIKHVFFNKGKSEIFMVYVLPRYAIILLKSV